MSVVTHSSGWKKLRKAIISIGILAVAVFAVVSISKMPARTEDVPAPQTEVSVNVEVMEVERTPQLADFLELPGTIEPNLVVDVPVELRGPISEVMVREGDRVLEGDVLMKLDTALLAAEYSRARAQAEFDQKTLDRSRALLEKGVVNKSQLEETEARVIVSSATLDVANTNLERATIRAPADGVLNSLLKERGEYVSPGDTVAQIVQIETLKVVVHVPEKDVPFVRKGKDVSVTVDALDELELTGKVTYMSEVADPLTHTTRVEVTVDNRRMRLHSGMIVRVRLLRRYLTNVIMVPLSAVIPLEEGRMVYVVEDGRAGVRTVELGLTKGMKIQVLQGLNPGDLLVISGHRQVSPGQSVRVISSQNP